VRGRGGGTGEEVEGGGAGTGDDLRRLLNGRGNLVGLKVFELVMMQHLCRELVLNLRGKMN
jgi:hypothetical protein